MAIAQLPQQSSPGAHEGAHEGGGLQSSESCAKESWTRPFATGLLITAAVLVGKRKPKAGIAAAGIGAIVLLLDDPERAAALWQGIPSCLEAGKRLLSQAEGFVGELEIQRARLRSVVERARSR